MLKFIANPFFTYITSFAIVLLVYWLGWSNLYPAISTSLLLFIIPTFFVAFVFAAFTQFRIQYYGIKWDRSILPWLVFIGISYCAEFLYNKGVPLIEVIQGNSEYNYRLFGVPTFHVFLVTINSFFSVYIFHQCLENFTKRHLLYFLLSLVPSVLIINRGMLLIILISCLFVFFLSLNKIRTKFIITICILILAFFYIFGIIGNIRQTGGATAKSDYILQVGKATKEFKESFIPKEFFWGYLYVSSPLANFQNTLNKAGNKNHNWQVFINYEILPDFISKRTGKSFNLVEIPSPQITEWLTVSTFYASAYVLMGWIGAILMFTFFIVTTFLYLFILKKGSKYYVTGLALINALVLFNTFDNMYSFSGLNLQLIYPFIFSIIENLKFKKSQLIDSTL